MFHVGCKKSFGELGPDTPHGQSQSHGPCTTMHDRSLIRAGCLTTGAVFTSRDSDCPCRQGLRGPKRVWRRSLQRHADIFRLPPSDLHPLTLSIIKYLPRLVLRQETTRRQRFLIDIGSSTQPLQPCEQDEVCTLFEVLAVLVVPNRSFHDEHILELS